MVCFADASAWENVVVISLSLIIFPGEGKTLQHERSIIMLNNSTAKDLSKMPAHERLRLAAEILRTVHLKSSFGKALTEIEENIDRVANEIESQTRSSTIPHAWKNARSRVQYGLLSGEALFGINSLGRRYNIVFIGGLLWKT